MLRHLPSSADSARTARSLVAALVRDLGRPELLDDAVAVVSELVANAVMHARTPIALTVEPRGAGVRVGVSDGSQVMPRWSPASATATSGRGLLLVEQLSTTWGAGPLASGGKTVWAQLDEPAAGLEDCSVDDLLARWVDDPEPVDPARGRIPVSVSIDVQAMLDSRAHTGDLVRELQLTLLDDTSNVTRRDFPPEVTAWRDDSSPRRRSSTGPAGRCGTRPWPPPRRDSTASPCTWSCAARTPSRPGSGSRRSTTPTPSPRQERCCCRRSRPR